MRKVNMFIALALMIAVLLLSACIQYTPQRTVAPPKTTVTILHGYSTTDLGVEDMFSEKILSAFPDIRLEWENVSWGDYFSNVMQARIASGDVPDIIIGKAQDVSSFHASGFLSSFCNDFTQHIEPMGLNSVSVDGVVYGIPYDMLYQGVLYNKEIFQEHDLQVPQTNDELHEIVNHLNEVGITPFASHFIDNWYAANIKMQFALNRMLLENPSWGDEFRNGERSFSDSENIIRSFEDVRFVFENSWDDSMLVTQRECLRRFSNGEAAMFVTGTWSVQTLQLIHPEMSVGIFPYPNENGDAKLIFEPNITFMANAQSENNELASQIIMLVVSDRELASSVSAFTQTESLVRGADNGSLNMVRDSINYYIENERLADVSIGNTQIAWIFQDMVARQMNFWLEGRIELSQVLEFADTNRSFSIW